MSRNGLDGGRSSLDSNDSPFALSLQSSSLIFVREPSSTPLLAVGSWQARVTVEGPVVQDNLLYLIWPSAQYSKISLQSYSIFRAKYDPLVCARSRTGPRISAHSGL